MEAPEEVIYAVRNADLWKVLQCERYTESVPEGEEFQPFNYRLLVSLFDQLTQAFVNRCLTEGPGHNADSCVFSQRSLLEKNPEWRQPIPYMVVTSMGRVLTYRRSKGVGESRLAGKRSFGFGGHVNREDGISAPANILAAAEREAGEELHLPDPSPYLSLQGLILSTYDATARDHMGIVFSLRTASAAVKNEAYVEEEWMTLEEVRSEIAQFEHWSQVLIRDLLPSLLVPPKSRAEERIAQYRPLNAPTSLPYAAMRDVAYLGNTLMKRLFTVSSYSTQWADLVAKLRRDRPREQFDAEIAGAVKIIGDALRSAQLSTDAAPLATLKQFGWADLDRDVKAVVLVVLGTMMLSTTLAGVRDASLGIPDFEVQVASLYHYLLCDAAQVDSLQEAMAQFQKAMTLAQAHGLRREDLEEAVRRIAFGS